LARDGADGVLSMKPARRPPAFVGEQPAALKQPCVEDAVRGRLLCIAKYLTGTQLCVIVGADG